MNRFCFIPPAASLLITEDDNTEEYNEEGKG